MVDEICHFQFCEVVFDWMLSLSEVLMFGLVKKGLVSNLVRIPSVVAKIFQFKKRGCVGGWVVLVRE